MEIRETTLKDATLLSRLFETSYRFHFSDLWYDKDELEEYIAEECSVEKISTSLKTPDHKWFIAESDHAIRSDETDSDISHSNIIGFSKVVLNQTVPDQHFTGIYLHKIYLMPYLTGQKQGGQLFDHVVKLGQKLEQKWLWLEVLENNKHAIKFYARKGMKWQKNILFSSQKQQSILHIMTKNLSD
ncbi:GNAT family N-acetyltransferase [Xenorhabdus littoralis]|uniref:GNAT family N-acetyltransferase n=1 Tax=Xenorhabdus littoralis TaxID=2582835 RepID=UPI0029E808B5|nr:GNAT family N-acetyltransferase [Xenorhabdus sp. Reich]